MKTAAIKENRITGLLLLAVIVLGLETVAGRGGETNSAITVASYYFGNYHPSDPRNEKNKGKGWAEWELVKAAKPRFPGHHQPNVPGATRMSPIRRPWPKR